MNDAAQICSPMIKNKQTSRAARMMVVSCERSPHSARKVRVRAWMKMGEMKLWHFPWGTVVPDPASTSGAPLDSLDLWSCKTGLDHKFFPPKLHFPPDLWKHFHNCVTCLHNTSHQKTVWACLVYSYSTRRYQYQLVMVSEIMRHIINSRSADQVGYEMEILADANK